MGLFFDNYDDCLDKYSSCMRAGDNSGAEAAILKAFNKDHDADEDGDLYYLLSLAQFEQDKDDIARINMENSADLNCQEALDLIAEANEDDGSDLNEIIKIGRGVMLGVDTLLSLLDG